MKAAWQKAFEYLTSCRVASRKEDVHMLTIQEVIEDLEKHGYCTEGMSLSRMAFLWVAYSSGGAEIYADGTVKYCGIQS